MKIRIVYETNSGGTYIGVSEVEGLLKAAGHEVEVQKARDVSEDYLFHDGLTILASPSWDFINEQGKRLEGHPHEMMYALINSEMVREKTDQKFAVFGLGDPDYSFFCGAVDHMEKYVDKVGGNLVIESLRIGGFYFDREGNLAKVRAWVAGLVEKL